ncbi:MAG: dynamin family protein [Anaerolineales bacterium]|nr:dynamin family protein [Anaerolineales bacterium]
MEILTKPQQALLKAERKLLNDLRVALVRFGATADDQATLEQSIAQLDEFFLLVVVGEFNAGKSAFINALLGQSLLKEGVTPTTTRVNLLRFGNEQGRVIESENLHILTAPLDLLANLSIVDTPGTNAVIREHEVITNQFVPRADLVLFVTSTDRPFSESERAFLERIRDWGKKVVVVLNKADLVQQEADLAEIETFIADNARKLLGITPEIFPLSARLALQAKQGQPQLWERSRFEALEQYVRASLDETSRLRLKFLNPLGVGEHLVKRYRDLVDSRLDLLQTDFSTLEDVERQLGVYEEDMRRDFNFRMADVENILYEMEQRGQEYFDETIRLGRVFDLVKRERIQREFATQVVADVPQRIEGRVAEIIDWLVESDLRQWQAVTEHLAERRRQHKDRIVGDWGIGSFHSERERLIEGVGREAQRVIENYDRARESQQIAVGVQNAVAAAAVLEVGAVGLGVLITALASTMAIDVTGIIMASLLALLGIFIIPAKRRQAKQDLRNKIAEMRTTLLQALRGQFEREIQRSLDNIRAAVAPYTRFVRAEGDKLKEMQSDLGDFQTELGRLRAQVEEQ